MRDVADRWFAGDLLRKQRIARNVQVAALVVSLVFFTAGGFAFSQAREKRHETALELAKMDGQLEVLNVVCSKGVRQ